MSLRPLDLQININSLNEISRLEGERVAREFFVRRQNELELQKEATIKETQVRESPETAVKHDVEKNAPHFGALNEEEVEVQEFLNRHGPHREDKEKEKKESPEKMDTQIEENLTQQGHVDFFA